MSNRRRVNISIDQHTYDQLCVIKKLHNFRNVCEVVTAMVHILVDRLEPKDKRKLDLPADDDIYIAEMFNDLGHVYRTPNGEVPKRKHRKTLNNYGER